MASSLTPREITIIILGCALSISVPMFLLYQFFLTPVERRLRDWASSLNYDFVRHNVPGFLDRPRAPWSWIWSPWGVWRVTVRDTAGLERVALVRLRGLRINPAPTDVRWEGECEDELMGASFLLRLVWWALLVAGSVVLVSRLRP